MPCSSSDVRDKPFYLFVSAHKEQVVPPPNLTDFFFVGKGATLALKQLRPQQQSQVVGVPEETESQGSIATNEPP